MRQRSGLLRRFVIWTGPIAGIAVLVVGGFLYWVLATTPGARWALVTAAMQTGGSVTGVAGSVWNGLHVDRLVIPTDAVSVDLAGLDLQVEWPALLQRQLHVRNLSAERLDVAMRPDDSVDDGGKDSFSMPAIPLQVRVDRLALDSFSMTLDGSPIPVTLSNLVSSLYLDAERGQVKVLGVDLAHDAADVHIDADFHLLDLADPWSFDAMLRADVRGRDGQDSLLCARRYLPELSAGPDPASGANSGNDKDADPGPNAVVESGDAAAGFPTGTVADSPAVAAADVQGEGVIAGSCELNVDLSAQGDLQALTVTARAQGQDMGLDAMLHLAPQAAFPLKDAHIDLTLPDKSSLHARVNWDSQQEPAGAGAAAATALDTVRGSLELSALDLGKLLGDTLPEAVLTASGNFEARIHDRRRLLSTSIDLDIAQGSVWNGQTLEGGIKAAVHGDGRVYGDGDVYRDGRVHRDGDGGGDGRDAPADLTRDVPVLPDWRTLVVDTLDIDVRLDGSHVRASGDFGRPESRLELAVQAPELAAFWPGLPGGVNLQGQVNGMVSDHELSLDALYTPDDSVPDALGRAPAEVSLALHGGWRVVEQAGQGDDARALEGWEGRILDLAAGHAGLALQVGASPTLRVVPGAPGPDALWQVGQADIGLALDGQPVLQLSHDRSSGSAAGQWATAGSVGRLEISPELLANIQSIVARIPGRDAADDGKPERRGGVRVRGADNAVTRIALALDWDLRFDQMLSGTAGARYLEGDVMVPAEPPFPLGLQELSLNLEARPQGNGYSRLDAELNVVTADMGRVHANATSRLLAASGGGFSFETAGTTATIQANIDDLGWVSLFTGDAMEFAGHLTADVTLVSQADGSWDNSGTITGTDIRIVRIDDGVRLLDGTLLAHLQNDRVILDKLEFPARLRVEPKEWRTAEWVSTNPDAQGGYLRLSGDWNLSDMGGGVDIEFYRYPVLQRSDRYAMVSGNLHIDAMLPALSITGRLEADAGWINLDMLGGIPVVDGDVVVIRKGDEPAEVEVPMEISMDIEVDLGPRVYLTGYGVNSGLVGNMRIIMVDNKLTAIGALRTRGGAIEAYGQRLQLRRGTITFQGDIASPVLNIEALRTGYAVQAGVRVSGTARKPVINLVSYPEVSELEKLSWLLFGHGPDESGGDMALLLSVGTALLGDGEPFYRKFGIDELTLQSGDIGSAGSILPAESVVSGLSAGASELERQFAVASKGVATGLTVSIRQALADAGTVGRVSYRLARGLTAELSVGTVNGLALVYRWFSRD